MIAFEANIELYPYLSRTHELNGVPWVESINAILATNHRGQLPFFARHDIRTSSLLPDECSWQLVMMVPCMDINLVLAEERISLLVCEIPSGAAALLAEADLGPVDRIVVGSGDDDIALGDAEEIVSVLAEKGFEAEQIAASMRFRRAALDSAGCLKANDRA